MQLFDENRERRTHLETDQRGFGAKKLSARCRRAGFRKAFYRQF